MAKYSKPDRDLGQDEPRSKPQVKGSYDDEKESKSEGKPELSELIDADNVMELLDDNCLQELAEDVIKGYDNDMASREDWQATADKILQIARLESTPKNFPRENAANVKYPLIPTAILQYSARTYPEIVKDGHVVSIGVAGADPDGSRQAKAERVAEFMDYQMLTLSDSWETQMDKTLQVYPTIGVAFKKIYYDPVKEQNVSVLCLHDEIVVNDNIPSLEEAPRITHVLKLSNRAILENMRAGLFEISEDDWEAMKHSLKEDEDFHELLEQHCWADLDDDEMEEPYIITVHKETQKVVRIKARFSARDVKYNKDEEVLSIKADQHFQDYHCIPRFDGKFHSIGIGTLLLHPNETVNTIYNQLLDAGYTDNVQTAIMSTSLELQDGSLTVDHGQILRVKNKSDLPIEQQMMFFKYPGPSQTLMALLQLTIESTKELSSFTEVMSGQAPPQNSPAYTIATLAEEGRKVFTALQRRLYRGHKGELDKWFKLNKKYLDPQTYFQVEGVAKQVFQSDFDENDLSVCPVVDPNMSSESQQIMKAQAIYQMFANDPAATQKQKQMAQQDLLKAMKVPNPERYLDQPPPPPPNPQLLAVQLDAQKHQDDMKVKQAELQLKAADLHLKAPMTEADTLKAKAQAMHQMASAADLHDQTQLEQAKLSLDDKKTHIDLAKHVIDNSADMMKEANKMHNAQLDREAIKPNEPRTD
jgi:chaperonin GroES